MTQKTEFLRLEPLRRPRIVPARALSSFLDDLAERAYRLHGLILWHRGQLCYADAADPYTLRSPHRLFSAAKSILVLAALKAMEQGRLRPEDRVISFFPDLPAHPSLSAMTVEDLLTMRTGQQEDPFGLLFQDFDADLIRAFLAAPAVENPGTRFRYNNTVPHMICAVVSRAVGMPFPDYMAQFFADPLQAPIAAPSNPQGIYNPVVTTMSMESFFRYALLFLHSGLAGGRRLLPEDLVRRAMAHHTPTGLQGNSAGYGWQIWMNAFGGCRMDGGWGQFAFLLPESDTCAVLLSDMTDCACAVDAFERCLLPALRGPAAQEPQPEVRLPGQCPPAAALSRPQAGLPARQDPAAQDLQPEVRLPSLAPAGHSTPDPDLPGSAWRFPDGSVLTLETGPDRVSLRLSGPRPWAAEAGLGGRFLPADRFLSRPVFSIDQTVYGVDASRLLLSAAWSSPRTLDLRAKSFGEMGEYAARLLFAADRVTVWRHEAPQHGIADPLTGIQSQGVRQ